MDTSNLMCTRYTDQGINTISDIEIFKSKIKNNTDKTTNKIYHLRLDEIDKGGWKNISFFQNNLLPSIDTSFVLLITGEDITIPNQLDIRYRRNNYSELIKKLYNSVLSHRFLLHCYIENRDEAHYKTSSLPLGINPRERLNSLFKFMEHIPCISNRPLKTICIHRPRSFRAGISDRQKIDNIKHNWKELLIEGMRHQRDFRRLLQQFPFVICAHGGGLDPSPKAWEALCLGCIPIIKHSALDDIYSEFPVVFVDDWNEDTITMDNMKKWIETHGKYYDDPVLKDTWKHKLYKKYWEDKIKSHFQ